VCWTWGGGGGGGGEFVKIVRKRTEEKEGVYNAKKFQTAILAKTRNLLRHKGAKNRGRTEVKDTNKKKRTELLRHDAGTESGGFHLSRSRDETWKQDKEEKRERGTMTGRSQNEGGEQKTLWGSRAFGGVGSLKKKKGAVANFGERVSGGARMNLAVKPRELVDILEEKEKWIKNQKGGVNNSPDMITHATGVMGDAWKKSNGQGEKKGQKIKGTLGWKKETSSEKAQKERSGHKEKQKSGDKGGTLGGDTSVIALGENGEDSNRSEKRATLGKQWGGLPVEGGNGETGRRDRY